MYMYVVGKQQGSYSFTFPIFLRRGDTLTVHYSTGPPTGPPEELKETITGLHSKGTILNVLVFPEQEPLRSNFNPSLPYLQWSETSL